MAGRIANVSAKYPWLVLEEDALGAGSQRGTKELAGFAYAHSWKERSAYRYAAELTIYLKASLRGKGRGNELFKALLDAVKKMGLHSLISGVTLPNEASVGLHEKYGFTKIAQFNEIGFKKEKWLDVGYWELIL
jgi:phosphinothricin acetyltransferase